MFASTSPLPPLLSADAEGVGASGVPVPPSTKEVKDDTSLGCRAPTAIHYTAWGCHLSCVGSGCSTWGLPPAIKANPLAATNDRIGDGRAELDPIKKWVTGWEPPRPLSAATPTALVADAPRGLDTRDANLMVKSVLVPPLPSPGHGG